MPTSWNKSSSSAGSQPLVVEEDSLGRMLLQLWFKIRNSNLDAKQEEHSQLISVTQDYLWCQVQATVGNILYTALWTVMLITRKQTTCSVTSHLRCLRKEGNGDWQGKSKASCADYHLDWKVEAGPLLHKRSPIGQKSEFIAYYNG